MGSGQAAVNPLYILPWAEALAELIAFVETDVLANWPGRQTAVAHELRTAVLKTRMRRGGGLPWPEFKGVALGEQQFPAIRRATTDILEAELLRAVQIAAAELHGQTTVCDDAVTWTGADFMVGHACRPMPGLVGGMDDAAVRAVCRVGPPAPPLVEPLAQLPG